MKVLSKLMLAACLLCIAPLALACNGKPCGKCAAGAMLKQMDTNGDGVISKDEFAAFHDARFQELDANKDGKITKDELEGSMQMMGGRKGDKCAAKKMKPIQP